MSNKTSKKQKLLLEYLISSSDTFALCCGIIKSEYFDPELINTVSFMFDYYEKYNNIPSPEQIDAETNTKLELYDIGKDQIEYCATEVETFCKHRAMELATLSLPKLIETQDYGKAEQVIKDAVTISLNKDLGISCYENVLERLNRVNSSGVTHSTGWDELDEKLFGGIARGELLLVSANSGGGKSVTLANLGLHFSESGLNVLYITLELSQDRITARSDTMITGINKDWRNNIEEIAEDVESFGKKCGRYDIKQMAAGSNTNMFRAFIKEYILFYGFSPDLFIVDYIDEMSPTEKVSADNVWEKDKRCSSQLRQILVDFNMYGATASQLGRSAVKAAPDDHDHSQIAGGISKINIADVYLSIIMTPNMRSLGQIVFVLLKTRNSDGVGSQIHLKWDGKYLRIRNQETLTFNKKEKEVNKLPKEKKKPKKIEALYEM
jgi:archaellum biogenesis ATPase FlaH